MAKKFPKKCKIYKLPIYNIPVIFFTDKKEFINAEKFMGAHDGNTFHGTGGYVGRYEDLETGEVTIMIGVFEHEYNFLVHELLHATVFICDTCGIKMDTQNHEAWCYIIGDLMDAFKVYFDEALGSKNV